jgi:hypothetical protein
MAPFFYSSGREKNVQQALDIFSQSRYNISVENKKP